ncbi:hypothetical protein BDV41DRAFT_133711 [Aspergillus transmontanensis]|uniref:Uncharacterized protein n=1 Tax=Aspergillus transmontanensis TaxID=1034304 RepID=A0A5N6W5J2_9EURO|nr:hypothetical protein BDV41DRAFT_133711 [Aspergillus transmontanensis]
MASGTCLLAFRPGTVYLLYMYMNLYAVDKQGWRSGILHGLFRPSGSCHAPGCPMNSLVVVIQVEYFKVVKKVHVPHDTEPPILSLLRVGKDLGERGPPCVTPASVHHCEMCRTFVDGRKETCKHNLYPSSS